MANAASPLVLRDIVKVYGSGPTAVHAVRGVSLEVREGEIVAIVGPSGSGKTTLLSIAGCLLRPTSGSVYILGEEATRLGQARLAQFRLRHIGFVFQSFNLLPALTAQENVEIALNLAGVTGRAARERARHLLDLLGLTPRAHQRPPDLSAGEQQRLAVARALANAPDIILADEPTANLDSKAGRRVMELMRSAVEQGEAKGLVVVTHDARILDVAHRVLTMEDGVLRAT
ncbi:MAG TPA: ABC transporter ATP-binding protein [Dehalococcoidia bacterium]|nr:ABC transporter ATP-binding protein [Dehalococcoidia bacterium]